MNRFRKVIAFSTLTVFLTSGVSFAQDRYDHQQDRNDHQENARDSRPNHSRPSENRPGARQDRPSYMHHQEWKKGYKMRGEDWGRGVRVDDYRQRRLRRPPAGYEWRQVDGNYVLAAVATGIIASVIIAGTR